MEPITRKEQYYDGMINDTPVPDPVTRDEHFLKNLADKIAQGGGGATSVTLAASGDNLSGDISLADLKTALSNGVVLLSFPTDGNADERVVAEYTDDSTNGLRIGVFSEDEYIVYSVVDDGNDGVTLTVVSERGVGGDVLPTVTSSDANKGLVVNSSGEWVKSGKTVAQWCSPPEEGDNICTILTGEIYPRAIEDVYGIGDTTLDLTIGESSINQILTAMKTLAAASVGTPVTRYVNMTGVEGIGLRIALRGFLDNVRTRKKYGKIQMGNNTYPVSSWYHEGSETQYNSKISWNVVEYDETNSKRYSTDITMAETSAMAVRIYLTTTCTDFSSLM